MKLAVFLIPALVVTGAVACGNPHSAAQQPSPVLTANPGTPAPTEAPATSALPPRLSQVTPVPVTPVAAATARPDCPAGWSTSGDPALSFCFPPDLNVLRGEKAGYLAYNIVSPDNTPDPMRVLFVALGVEQTAGIDAAATCEGASPLIAAHDFASQQVQLMSGLVTGCVAAGNDGAAEARSLMLSVPFGGGYLNFSATYRGTDEGMARSEIDQVLASLRFP